LPKKLRNCLRKQLRKVETKRINIKYQAPCAARNYCKIGSECSKIQVKTRYGEKHLPLEVKHFELESVEKILGTDRRSPKELHITAKF